ncbi:hypothetical protein RTM1035_15487 [Roseovarius sp. TM1035]|jgi:SAM-dependent MidA family methyltransferase|uniref:class I SAM-dependent methyltransferase n=1 Tax=Roseovarius sp. TM1035 TaxID=391613 RepID=UPI0001556E31|nr:SAM-dependent methyltransferase [Roseovarius sp. TM1035]AWZ19223.1 hypothetical protein RAK1035_0512 [Roseovarius sp. AK1035]EDM33400.1 hypothetical protein RTM1035_15487 [Roseovarius sp. TM1035]
MSGLRAHFLARIAEAGPMSLADYMAVCLMHPEFGYYATRDPFGARGDFITAPEISQMFGELLGLCLAQVWLDQGRPARFLLAELGPGRGTLMADVLRATQRVPGFREAAEVHLVEGSAVLRAAQRRAIAGDVIWHERVESLPEGPLYLLANEFFDALPIRQFQRSGEGWRERVVGQSAGQLLLGLGGPVAPPALAERLVDTREGDIVETCGPAAAVMAEIGARIEGQGGAALIVDYGDWRSLGDTFQALKAHQPVDPLAEPGAADLTAHVDFEALALAAAPALHTRLTPQGVFLERLGIAARAEALARNLSGPALETHLAAYQRLTGAEEMGTLLKVMGLYPEGAAPPPGLEP